MSMSESDMASAIARSIMVAYPTAWVMKAIGGYGYAGVPSLLVSVKGHMIALEVRLQPDRETELPAAKFRRMVDIRRSGATVAVVSQPREALTVIDEAVGGGYSRKRRENRFTS